MRPSLVSVCWRRCACRASWLHRHRRGPGHRLDRGHRAVCGVDGGQQARLARAGVLRRTLSGAFATSMVLIIERHNQTTRNHSELGKPGRPRRQRAEHTAAIGARAERRHPGAGLHDHVATRHVVHQPGHDRHRGDVLHCRSHHMDRAQADPQTSQVVGGH